MKAYSPQDRFWSILFLLWQQLERGPWVIRAVRPGCQQLKRRGCIYVSPENLHVLQMSVFVCRCKSLTIEHYYWTLNLRSSYVQLSAAVESKDLKSAVGGTDWLCKFSSERDPRCLCTSISHYRISILASQSDGTRPSVIHAVHLCKSSLCFCPCESLWPCVCLFF